MAAGILTMGNMKSSTPSGHNVSVESSQRQSATNRASLDRSQAQAESSNRQIFTAANANNNGNDTGAVAAGQSSNRQTDTTAGSTAGANLPPIGSVTLFLIYLLTPSTSQCLQLHI